nr:pentatricopeptide repeat-containing protein, chloroplastic [Quercus suber]
MALSSCLKCYPLSLPHTINHHPSPLSFSHKPTSNSFISFASTQHHDQVTAPSPVSNSTPPTTLSQLPSDFTPKQLLDTLRRQTDESSALRIFEWASKQSSFTPSSAIYEEILRKLGKVGSFESMRSVLEEMKLAGCEISTGTFLIFIMSYAEFELYDEIVGVVEMMENEFGLKPDTHFCNFLLNVLVDGNKLKLVETMHSSMVSRGIKPDVSTFNVLIKALCKAHQIRPAILMMEEMPNYGLSPDEKTFTTLMQGYIEEGNISGALRIREQMVEVGCPCTSVTVNVLDNFRCGLQLI